MFEHAVDVGLAAYGSIWATVNAYSFYPEMKRRIDEYMQTDEDTVPDTGTYDDIAIDLLIPAYDEADVIEYPLASIEDAPSYGSEVNPTVLLEPDDDATAAAIEELDDQYTFDVEVVPEDYPGEGAKPRALNYGFEQTDGDLVAVMDAEDQIDDRFFEEIYSALLEEDNDYGQGVLDMANEDDGWRHVLFRGEYGNWFRNLMPAYHAAGYPVPLGGTTNVFHRDVLEEISELREERFGHSWDTDDRFWLFEHGMEGYQPWDPDNVTEDFELGMLLWEQDYDMAMLETVTTEQSPQEAYEWLTQRTRWQKGKIQTLSQYLEEPPKTGGEKAHIYLQSALPHLGPINASGVSLSLGAMAAGVSLNPAALTMMSAGAVGVAGHMLLQADGYRKATDENGLKKHLRTLESAVTLPAYWGLQWLADGRAMKQFYSDNDTWEKTEHHDLDAIYEDDVLDEKEK